jgi:hypothetical protein
MSHCQHFQSQVWDHLYGLLDEAESLALIEHVGQCEDCREALLRADTQKHLLGAAAHTEFAGLRFVAPSPAETANVRPKPRRLAFPTQWRRYAVAAGILLAVLTAATPVALHIGSIWSAESDLKLADARMTELRKQERQAISDQDQAIRNAKRRLQALDHEQERLYAAQNNEFMTAAQEIEARKLVMVVTGPENIRPGEQTTFKVETRSLAGQPAPAKVNALARDKTTGKILFEQKNIDSTGQVAIKLDGSVVGPGGNNLALEISAVGADGARGTLTEELSLLRSAFVTHLVTDKPMYHPGETVHFRSLTLDRFTLKPAAEDLDLTFTLVTPTSERRLVGRCSTRLFGLKNGQYAEVIGPDKKPVRGLAVGEFPIAEGEAGGEYILEVANDTQRFPTERRKFVVNKYQKPTLHKTIKFDKESYGLGDDVTVRLKVEKSEGGTPIMNQPITAVVRVDGKPYQANGELAPNEQGFGTTSNEEGQAVLKFKLPAEADKGEASLSLTFTDGATPETAVRPIQIANKLFIEFFPEGGELIAGVPNRVYFQARTPLGKPATVKGVLLEGGTKVVCAVATLNDPNEPGINQGTGAFTFTPLPGHTYRVKATEPSGIKDSFKLPDAVDNGIALSVPTGVTTDLEPIKVTLHAAGNDRDLMIGLYCRGRLLAFEGAKAVAGKPTELTLKPTKDDVGGIYRVTVFDKQMMNGNNQLKPVAERLIYRSSVRKLNLTVKTDKREYLPRDTVHMTINSTDENGKPLPSILMVGVVDQSLLNLADERTARTMPTHFLLTSEVRNAEDLEFSDVLLSEHARAPEALDLLLGTQGWRRFLESDPNQLKNLDGKRAQELRCQAQDVDRLRVASGMLEGGFENVATSIEQKKAAIIAQFKPDFDRLTTDLADARAADALAQKGTDLEAKKAAIQQQFTQTQTLRAAAIQRLKDADHTTEVVRGQALLMFGVLLLAAGAVCLMVGLNRGLTRTMPFYAGAVGAVAVCGLVLIGTFMVEVQPNDSVAQAPSRRPNNKANADMPGAAPAPTMVDDGGNFLGDREADQAAGDQKKKALEELQKEPKEGADRDALKFKDARRPGAMKPMPEAKPAANAEALPVPPMAPPAPFAAANGPMPVARKRFDAQGAGKQAAAPGFNNRPLMDGIGGGAGFAKKDEAERGEKATRALENLQEEVLRKSQGYLRLEQAEQNAFGAALANQAKGDARRGAIAGPSLVREYAHRVEAGTGSRSDFTETVLWQPVVVLPDGRVDTSFQLCDSVTRFQVIAFGHTTDGRLGANIKTEVASRIPLSLSAKLPNEVTANDVLDLPVTVTNSTTEPRQVKIALKLEKVELTVASDDNVELLVPAGKSERRIFRIKPTIRDGMAHIAISATAEPFAADAVDYALKVVPEGFPVDGQVSDVLEGGHAQHTLRLPEDVIKGTLKAQLTLYPSPLADLQKGLEGLLREPNGCFEQTSTSNYPNVLILGYLKEAGALNASNSVIEDRANDLLKRGYAKLVGFECQKPGGPVREGYEWFGGQAPPHEALTAYGLMEFRDMVRIGFPANAEMIERTEKYLLSRRDGKGGFLRNGRAIDTFGRAPDHITNAYIVWALTEGTADMREKLDLELTTLATQAKDSKDPYFLGLVANCLVNTGRDAMPVLKQLAALQKDTGVLDGAQTSITCSGGRDLQIETTALALLAWAKANRPLDFHGNVDKAVRWVAQQRGGYGGFGSTQSTILALKALLTLAKVQKSKQTDAPVALLVNGHEVAKGMFLAKGNGPITLTVDDAEKVFDKADNEVEIQLAGGEKQAVPYTLGWSCQTLKPRNAEACPVTMTAKLSKTEATDGETVHLTVTVTNTTDKGQGMAVAIVGLPAGLILPENLEQLRQHTLLREQGTKDGLISAFEVRGRELVIYWRSMAPKATLEVPIDLICKVPGEFRGPASRSYLYYNADAKYWLEPITANVRPGK